MDVAWTETYFRPFGRRCVDDLFVIDIGGFTYCEEPGQDSVKRISPWLYELCVFSGNCKITLMVLRDLFPTMFELCKKRTTVGDVIMATYLEECWFRDRDPDERHFKKYAVSMARLLKVGGGLSEAKKEAGQLSVSGEYGALTIT